MKNLFIAACAFAVLAFTSCQKDDVVDNNVDNKTFDVVLQTNLNNLVQEAAAFNIIDESNAPIRSSAFGDPSIVNDEGGLFEFKQSIISKITITMTSHTSDVIDIVIPFLKDESTNRFVSGAHYITAKGYIFLNQIPQGNYSFQITATNDADINARPNLGLRGHYLLHQQYTHDATLDNVKEVLATIVNTEDPSDVYTPGLDVVDNAWVPATKNYISNIITSDVPVLDELIGVSETDGRELPDQMFVLELQHDLYGALVHRTLDDRLGVDLFIAKGAFAVNAQDELYEGSDITYKKYLPGTAEYAENDVIASYSMCDCLMHCDFMTVFQDEKFRINDDSPATDYMLYFIIYDRVNYEYIGIAKLPLVEEEGGIVHLKDITFDRTHVNVYNMSLSFEKYSVIDWAANAEIISGGVGGFTMDQEMYEVSSETELGVD